MTVEFAHDLFSSPRRPRRQHAACPGARDVRPSRRSNLHLAHSADGLQLLKGDSATLRDMAARGRAEGPDVATLPALVSNGSSSLDGLL
jgi:hypothetical protein